MELSDSDKTFIARLEAMPLEQARKELAAGTFGRVGSPNHTFTSSWLAVKEANLRDSREAESLSISRKALRISYIAMIIAVIAIILPIVIALLTKK